jgi:multidrug efflux pump
MGTDAVVTDSVTKIIEKRVYKVLGANNPDVTSVITNVGSGCWGPSKSG